MGKLLTRLPQLTLAQLLPQLTLAQLQTLRSTTGGTFHRDLENFPSPRWEKCLCACPDSRLHNYERFGQLQNVRAAENLKSSHRPDGKISDGLL